MVLFYTYFSFPFSEPQTHVVRGRKDKQFINKRKEAVGINYGFFSTVLKKRRLFNRKPTASRHTRANCPSREAPLRPS